MLLLYDVWFYSIVSLIHHLCKREMKRNVEAIVCVLVGCVFLCYIHTVQYSIHDNDDMVFYTGRDPQIPEIPKKRSTSSECKVQKWIWSGCTAAMCLKRVQSPHGNDSNGNKWRSPRRKGKSWSFFFGHMS